MQQDLASGRRRGTENPGARPVVGARLRAGARAAWFVVLAALTALLVHNVLPYLGGGTALPFLIEKEPFSKGTAWRVAFLLHVAGGIACMLSALPQFSQRILRRRPALHRALGWAYVSSVLVLLAPTGVYLSVFAKGGIPGRLGFLLQGVALLAVTWRGLERIRVRDFKGHVAWMVRSYALVATALTFRVLHLLLYQLEVGNEYVLGIWLSMVINITIAESLLLWRRAPKGEAA